MERKWEWIANRIPELDISKKDKTKLIKIAKEIDSILVKLYKKKHSEEWTEDCGIKTDEFKNSCPDEKMDLIDSIAGSRSYCVACIEHKRVCHLCKFKEVAGECGTYGSLVDNFFEIIDRIIEKELCE